MRHDNQHSTYHISLHMAISPDLYRFPRLHSSCLQHRKQYIDEREVWVYAINILEGLAALHAKGVVHRGR